MSPVLDYSLSAGLLALLTALMLFCALSYLHMNESDTALICLVVGVLSAIATGVFIVLPVVAL